MVSIRQHLSRVPILLLLVTLGWVLASPAAALTADEENTIRIYETLQPSVVTVLAENMPIDASRLDLQAGVSLGSGFAIEPGLIVTNYHVIANARIVFAVLHDGRREVASVVGTAPDIDLALLRADFAVAELPPAAIGTASGLRVGQKVLTLSSPLGLHHSVTVGVLSSLYRELPGFELGPNLLQFDAPLNRGQSGGPLADSDGHVIGVTTAKVEPAEAIGFAIPVDVVVNVLPDLKLMGHPFQPEIGFAGTTVTPELAALFELPVTYGVLVESTASEGVAAQAGLRGGTRHVHIREHDYVLGGDILVAVNDIPLRGTGDLVRRLLATRPGDRLVFAVTDGSKPRTVEIIVPEMRH